MTAVQPSRLPPDAFLDAYVQSGAYTDCYCLELARLVTHAELIAAFYTTVVFKIERWLLGVFLSKPTTDSDAQALALGQADTFAAWTVERRAPNQILLAAGRTRSWLMVLPGGSNGKANGTRLFFGSAVVPRRGHAAASSGGSARMGWQFRALLGFHKLYSRVLLAAAGRKLGG